MSCYGFVFLKQVQNLFSNQMSSFLIASKNVCGMACREEWMIQILRHQAFCSTFQQDDTQITWSWHFVLSCLKIQARISVSFLKTSRFQLKTALNILIALADFITCLKRMGFSICVHSSGCVYLRSLMTGCICLWVVSSSAKEWFSLQTFSFHLNIVFQIGISQIEMNELSTASCLVDSLRKWPECKFTNELIKSCLVC